MKKCSKCKENKEYYCFYTRKDRKSGYSSRCIVCEKDRQIKKYAKHKESIDKSNKKWQKENKDKVKAIKDRYRNKETSKDIESKQRRKWQKENKDKTVFYSAKRRAQKLNATLEGYDVEIKEIYKNCPEGYHVDHIMPLQGNGICGLHVPWNLQYLTAEENLRKSNSY